VFREARRGLKDDGTLWLNLGDSYSNDYRGGIRPSTNNTLGNPDRYNGESIRQMDGLKPKDLLMIPPRVAIALQDDGWWVRSEICWTKPNPMPESVTDRPTKAHEMIYLLTKSARYFYDNEAVREKPTGRTDKITSFGKLHDPNRKGYQLDGNVGANLRTVWRANGNGYALVSLPDDAPDEMTTVFNIATRPFTEAHFATFPVDIPLRCIKAGSSEAGECPHCGKAWVRVVEREDKRHWTERNDYTKSKYQLGNNASGRNDGRADFATSKLSTIGWRPQCQCPAHEPVPQTILDPFNGAATTGVAALLLNRNYIGIELNPDYLEISRKRLQNYAIEMPDEIEQPKVIKQQIAMF